MSPSKQEKSHERSKMHLIHIFLSLLGIHACLTEELFLCSEMPGREGGNFVLPTCELKNKRGNQYNAIWQIKIDDKFLTMVSCFLNTCRYPNTFPFQTDDNNHILDDVDQRKMKLTITNISRAIDDTTWRCKGKTEFLCLLKIYSVPAVPTCTSQFKRDNSMTDSLRLLCKTSKVYPEATCVFFISSPFFNSTSTQPEDVTTEPLGQAHPVYYKQSCSIELDLTRSRLGQLTEGMKLRYGISMYHNVSGKKWFERSSNEDLITFQLPKTELGNNCPEWNDQWPGYWGKKGTPLQCNCVLKIKGTPPGLPVWTDSSGQVVSTDEVLRIKSNEKNETFFCKADSILANDKTGVPFHPLFAYGPDAVEGPYTQGLVTLCPFHSKVIHVQCFVPKLKVYPRAKVDLIVNDNILQPYSEEGTSEGDKFTFQIDPELGTIWTLQCRGSNLIFPEIRTLGKKLEWKDSSDSFHSQSEFTAGQEATLTCLAFGQPLPVISLYKSGTKLSSVHVTQTEMSRTVDFIKVMSCKDTGSYTCYAEHKEISDECTFGIYVTCGPTLEQKSRSSIPTYTGKQGGSATMILNIVAYPQPHHFALTYSDGSQPSKTDILYYNSTSFLLSYHSENGYEGIVTLVIPNLTSRNVGHYQLTIGNGQAKDLEYSFIIDTETEKQNTDTSNQGSNDNGGNSDTAGYIVAGVVVVLAGALVAAIIIVFRRKAKHLQMSDEPSNTVAASNQSVAEYHVPGLPNDNCQSDDSEPTNENLYQIIPPAAQIRERVPVQIGDNIRTGQNNAAFEPSDTANSFSTKSGATASEFLEINAYDDIHARDLSRESSQRLYEKLGNKTDNESGQMEIDEQPDVISYSFAREINENTSDSVDPDTYDALSSNKLSRDASQRVYTQIGDKAEHTCGYEHAADCQKKFNESSASQTEGAEGGLSESNHHDTEMAKDYFELETTPEYSYAQSVDGDG